MPQKATCITDSGDVVSIYKTTLKHICVLLELKLVRCSECCQAGSAIITKVERKEKSEKPPALFDLTSLQREANQQLGFTAQQTLDYAQALYEKKFVTYPRTDSRYLTDDMAPLVPELVSAIQQSFQIQPDVPAPVNAA